MRHDLDHLPATKQRELARVVDILQEEFESALRNKTSAPLRDGRILRIVLFGSHARGGWVDEPHTMKGYLSDYDLLVIVSHKDLTDFATYWYKAEDRLIRDKEIKPVCNFIVHTLHEVNDALAAGQYFFSDIVKEGIALYELKGAKRFGTPKPLTPKEARETAQKHYDFWVSSAGEFYDDFERNMEMGRFNKAAFELHQAVERLYHCALLVYTNYSPSSHNIKFLRGLVEQLAPTTIDAWPRETRDHRRRFEHLKRAYVEARYSEHFTIEEVDLAWLGERVAALRKLVEGACLERLER